jgi:hypothetical protein
MLGICRTGILEFAISLSMGTGVPFQAQSSINSNTIFGFWISFAAFLASPPQEIKIKRLSTIVKADFITF